MILTIPFSCVIISIICQNCLPEESDSDSVVFEHEFNLDEDSAISSDMSVGIDFNEDDVSDDDEACDAQEELPDSDNEPESTTDVKQRVILALEEFSNTILRKVVELENKEKEKQDAKLKCRTSETSGSRNRHSSARSLAPIQHEEMPDR